MLPRSGLNGLPATTLTVFLALKLACAPSSTLMTIQNLIAEAACKNVVLPTIARVCGSCCCSCHSAEQAFISSDNGDLVLAVPRGHGIVFIEGDTAYTFPETKNDLQTYTDLAVAALNATLNEVIGNIAEEAQVCLLLADVSL